MADYLAAGESPDILFWKGSAIVFMTKYNTP